MSEYPNLDKKIKINFFCGPKKKSINQQQIIQCNHIGYLEYDGFNIINGLKIQRIKCSKCEKRFGNAINLFHLLTYQEKIKKVVYEIFFLRYPLNGIAIRWGILQDKLSRFKKRLVHQIYQQNQGMIEEKIRTLPRGIILGDETFMGSMGNSHTQIQFINNVFEVLSTGPAEPGNLGQSILNVFENIPEICRKKLRLLISDGEPSYKSIPQRYGGKIIHLIQYHNNRQLGQVSIEKYEKVGPHLFHYIIKTHWKVFAKGTHELQFRWQIKFIKNIIYSRRGRPPIHILPKKTDQKWRQKIEDFQNGKIQTRGTAKVYINFKTDKISKRAGSTNWMIRMLNPLFKVFKGQHMTTGYVESKHHQVKSVGARRKQQDPQYNHELFALCCYIVDNGHLPSTNFQGRPLYKYLMKNQRQTKPHYVIMEKNVKIIQTTLPVV